METDITTLERHDFADPSALALQLAETIADQLNKAIAAKGHASLVVSGGTTPLQLFEVLSMQDIAWKQVTITLVDERFVAPDNERSNEKLVRDHLMKNKAEQAGFISLYGPAQNASVAAVTAANRIDAIQKPFDVVVLGMGNDGHTASFFRGGNRLDQAIDPETRAIVLPMVAEGAGEPRLTLTLPLLTSANLLILHIEGQKKLSVLEEALSDDDAMQMPVRAIFAHAKQPVQLYWAP
ncbi:6-phosphogluconolactonase [Pseudochrobactrum sp. MP213Fo]|uniref:6-phosphogluconolactonase n=1 Tax=Pseudochrobactrum sp. MP213Fo TaxID=3022250 RepID=UPI003BA02F4B